MGRRVRWEALRSECRALAGAAGLAVVHQLCEVSIPVLVGVVIDRAIAPGAGEALAWSLAGLAALFVMRVVAASFGLLCRVRAIVGAAQSARMEVVEQALTSRGLGGPAGIQLSLTSSDAEAIGHSVTAVVFVVSGLAALLIGSALLVATSPAFAWVLLATIPLALIVSRLAAVPLEQRTAVQQQAAASATALVTDLCSGLRVLRGIGAGPAAADRYRAESAQMRRAFERSARMSGIFEGVSEAAMAVSAVPVVWLGGLAVVDGRLTVGEFVAVVGLVTYVSGQAYRFTEAVAYIAAARVSAGRLASVLRSAPPTSSGSARLIEPPAGEGVDLELRGVNSGSLDRLDLRVARSELLGVVCISQRDADALMDVLARRADVGAGQFFVAGRDVANLDVPSVRSVVHVEPHHCMLLGSTVAASVTDTARGEVDAALHASGADDVIRTLPDGADTRVGERGSALSGGQRQRVALARALAATPPVLVLRDPTTAVDTVTESRIASRLAAARGAQATVIVTSSPALLAVADRVVLIDGGRVVASGSHATLLDTVADYRAAVLS